MAILSDHVAGYLQDLRPERSPVMAEMEALAEREGIPIVHWETGRFLASLVKALRPELVLEVGTAIGYSTLHMAESLDGGRIQTLEIDARRAARAREFMAAAGVAERVEVIEGDARQTIATLDGPFGLVFLDAAKDEYREYLELAEPKSAPRAALVVDNLLMSGEVALPEGAATSWAPDRLEAARALNRQLLRSETWLGSDLPIGDGVGFAARR